MEVDLFYFHWRFFALLVGELDVISPISVATRRRLLETLEKRVALLLGLDIAHQLIH